MQKRLETLLQHHPVNANLEYPFAYSYMYQMSYS